MTKILVLLGDNYISAVKGLGEIKTDPIDFLTHPLDYGLVLFTGGEDITPEFYGETSPLNLCRNSERRDTYEKKVFNCAIANGVRMTGICRGIQFLNVMAGGRMYHDVGNHAGVLHDMILPNNDILQINSLHHQMVIPPDDGLIAGWTPKALSKEYYGDSDLIVKGPYLEPEAFIYPSIQSAGVQYHPEMMSPRSEGWKYFYDMAKALIETDNFSDVISKFMGETWETGQHMQLAH
jgi:gamma-glutamyl-gamma-aminobutyrate hydrolase PuuD